MKNLSKKIEALEYFLGLSETIIPEMKDLLFSKLIRVSIDDSIPKAMKENEICLIMELYNLLKGLEPENN